MIQEINLYRSQVFTANNTLITRMLVLWAVALALVLAYAAYAGWRLHQMDDVSRQVQVQRDETTAALEQHRRQAISPEMQSLESNRALLRAELADRQKILQQVLDNGSNNQTGFSEQLFGLARQRVAGLWLDHILLINGGRSVKLSGYANSERLVPELLQKLGQEKSFEGLSFKQVEISRVEAPPETFHFVLRSESNMGGAP